MSTLKENKTKVMGKFARSPTDTGSPEVQVAWLTARIQSLTEHLKTHKKDMSAKYGMMLMTGRRRRLLDYLKKENAKSYETLISKLGIRK